MGKILVLPEEVSGKIAAGEVIDGPYSIVRELMDNSLDADAQMIKITVNNGGKDFIQVADNGTGMSADDALLSVRKHTTSKIKDIEDLNTITTMGFRGEALSSICTVSAFTMLTRGKNEDSGIKVIYCFGKDPEIKPSAANEGTEVTVKDLFQNLPVRRKFLKSNRAENARIKDEVLKKALSFYEIGFTFKADDRSIYRLIPKNNNRERIEEIFGSDLNENLIEIFHEDELFTIHGFISNKKHTLSNRNGQFLFINRRPIFDRSLLFAVNNPARGIVPAGRYIYAFVFIEINPSLIDVNVHPAKKEIRIKFEKNIHSKLYSIVEQNLYAGFYPAGFKHSESKAVEYKPTEFKPAGYKPPDFKTAEFQEERNGNIKRHYFENPAETPVNNARVMEAASFMETGEKDTELFNTMIIGDMELDISQEGLFPASLDKLFYKGLVFQTYILFEGRDFLLMVDQHAAHERVLYERLKDDSKNLKSVKNLLIPINFIPPRSRYAGILENIDTFKEAGFEIEPFGDESFNIITIPAFVPDEREEETISCLLEEFNAGRMSPDAREIREGFIKLVSCRTAIKEGNVINEAEARALLKDLRNTKIPYVCPHGRPTFVRITKVHLEKVFKRR